MILSPLNYSNNNFSFDFFQKEHLNNFYDFLHNSTNSNQVKNDKFNSKNDFGDGIHEVKFIPSYFKLEPNLLDPQYKFIKFHRVNNFQIRLDGFKNTEDFLDSQMGSKTRSQLRSRMHRLETCFNITYKFYYGDISKEKYDFLFKELELLIERRFKQRGDLYSLKHKWELIKENTHQLILEKKASLFVIYDENKPIDICLSYHFQNIVHHLIRSYDIDYSKYWVGQIDIYKQIEWCFLNGFIIFDLMWGELLYKVRWSNNIKLYEHQFIYKNSLVNNNLVRFMIEMYKIKDILEQKKLYKYINKVRSSALLYYQSRRVKRDPILKIKNITKTPLIKNLTKVNISNEDYNFLKKTVFDFQYLNFENSNNINVYKINNDSNSFIIQGNKSQIKATLLLQSIYRF